MDSILFRRLVLEALVAEKTARKWLRDPRSIRPGCRARLERAARKLAIELPGAKAA